MYKEEIYGHYENSDQSVIGESFHFFFMYHQVFIDMRCQMNPLINFWQYILEREYEWMHISVKDSLRTEEKIGFVLLMLEEFRRIVICTSSAVPLFLSLVSNVSLFQIFSIFDTANSKSIIIF